MGGYLSQTQLQVKEETAEDIAKKKAEDVARNIAEVINLSDQQENELNNTEYQIVINRSFNITDGPKDISGHLLSIIEESFPLDSKSNVRWITQQIVHGVSGAYSGLPKPYQKIERTSLIRNKFQGDLLEIDFSMNVWVFDKKGEYLETRNQPTFELRLVMGIKHTTSDQQMSAITKKILLKKDGREESVVQDVLNMDEDMLENMNPNSQTNRS